MLKYSQYIAKQVKEIQIHDILLEHIRAFLSLPSLSIQDLN